MTNGLKFNKISAQNNNETWVDAGAVGVATGGDLGVSDFLDPRRRRRFAGGFRTPKTLIFAIFYIRNPLTVQLDEYQSAKGIFFILTVYFMTIKILQLSDLQFYTDFFEIF